LVCSLPAAAQAADTGGPAAEILPSLSGAGGYKQAGGQTKGLSADWPTLAAEAYHGLFGDMLTAIGPETEADPASVLLGWLTCFGNIVGRGAWFQVGPRQHHPALYVGVVGRTSDAKGDGWAASLWPFKQIEPAWAGQCIANGVGSGEGLVDRLADPQTVHAQGRGGNHTRGRRQTLPAPALGVEPVLQKGPAGERHPERAPA
jgi:hypothetical protein